MAGRPQPEGQPADRWAWGMNPFRTLALFGVTALAELIGCYLPYLWLRQRGSAWLLLPAALSLAAFAWLLTLHPTASGRVYAAYGGVYVVAALVWLRVVDGVSPRPSDLLGGAVILTGLLIIILGAPSR